MNPPRYTPIIALSAFACAGLIAGRAKAAPVPAAVSVSRPIIAVADARHPYSNIDHSVDAGNDTGDLQVDILNEQQLNENYRGPYYYGRPPPPGVRPPAGPPPVAYRPPAPGYYPPPPPGYYPPPPGYPPPGYPPPGYPPPGY